MKLHFITVKQKNVFVFIESERRGKASKPYSPFMGVMELFIKLLFTRLKSAVKFSPELELRSGVVFPMKLLLVKLQFSMRTS